MGNGLRGDVWREFIRRFGDISIYEFYASTEGNIGFMNYTRKIGAVGRVNYLQKVSTLKYETICSQFSECRDFFFKFTYLFWERQRQHEWGGAEREGKRESQAGSALPAQSPTKHLSSQNHEIMTWAETKSWTLNWLSHLGAPMQTRLKRYHDDVISYCIRAMANPCNQERGFAHSLWQWAQSDRTL